MIVLELQNVTKTFGKSRAVEGVSLQIPAGSITGFLGPNGAGKTTTISMLVDLTRPTSGHIKLFGLDAQRDSLAIRKRIGFLAGDFALDRRLSGRQQLQFFANLRGGVDWTYVTQLTQRLEANLDRPIHTLSRGNKQKIGLISALMHQPELLIFDEPTSGLDPLIQAEFNKIINEHKAAGKTAFISSHTLSEVQAICDEVAFIREGKLLAVRKMSDVISGSIKQIRLVSRDNKLLPALEKLPGFSLVQRHQQHIEGRYQGDSHPLLQLLAKHDLQDVVIAETDLEEIFMEYYEAKDA